MPSRGLVGGSSRSQSVPDRLARAVLVSVTSVTRSQMWPLSRSCGNLWGPR